MFPGLEAPGLETVQDFPHQITDMPIVWIRMPDGVRLAARIWRPAASDEQPVPAVLEYIPYRKRDGRLSDDERIHPWFAGHGIAGVRVDIRGSGDSEGILTDEYLTLEHDDAIAVIEWIAAQPWCDGNVGMMGLSWGGFNSLQVAARNPPALKAVIAVGATVDRYNDDVHYKNGCLLNENFGWASSFLSFATRPPDPAVVGDVWREMWLERLDKLEFFASNWFAHSARDDYWKHGSVCEDYDAIKCPVMIVTGWGDLYVNAVPRLLENLSVPCRAIAGPWAHQYPHLSSPGPLIDFLGEAMAWWQRWLNDAPLPDVPEKSYLGFVQHGSAPDPFAAAVPGHWLAAFQWPCPEIEMTSQYFASEQPESEAETQQTAVVRSPVDTGTTFGELVPHCGGPEMPTDQRADDGRCLCLETSPFDDAVDIWGDPVFEVTLTSSAADGNLIVRLCDIAPDGASQRVSVGVLNLRHLDGNEDPKPCAVDVPVSCRIQMDHVAHRFPAGHRLRIALSSACWPNIWPASEDPILSVLTSTARLDLPVVSLGEHIAEVQPDGPRAPPAANIEVLKPSKHERRITHDDAERRTVLDTRDDYGEVEYSDHGMVNHGVKWEHYAISHGDPLSATCDVGWTQLLRRDDWTVTTRTVTRLTCDATQFHVSAIVTAQESGRDVFNRTWHESFPRK